jgi:phosphomannomutase
MDMSTNTTALAQLDAAAAAGKLSATAASHIRAWLTQPYLAEYAPQVAELLADEKWPELEDAFWTVIPFGTGGRRGRMYPVGCNAVNDRTIGESAQGLADYVKKNAVPTFRGEPRQLRCAIGYDTRHRSRHFAELCAEIMAAAGFYVYFLDGYRSTPELSFAVRYNRCDCGIIITASHNPPADNAVKVYGPSGGQYVPPADADSIAEMQNVSWIRRIRFKDALKSEKIIFCQEEVDAAFCKAVLRQTVPGPRDLRILYSPLHGVGSTAVPPALAAAGFDDCSIYGPHSAPDGDFPNVPNHVANPENPAVFTPIIEEAKQTGAELILATDPDSDRLGCAVRLTPNDASKWTTLTGNQLGSLLTDFLLAHRKAKGSLSAKNYVVKTLVTTELIRHIADHYGVQTAGNLLVGFKWIGAEMDARGPKDFIIGAEESYGFLIGDHVRDKDAAVSSLVTACMAAQLKEEGKTLYGRLLELYRQYGCFSESQINVQMPGEKGMDDMRALMSRVQTNPPASLAGMKVARLRDYQNQVEKDAAGNVTPLDAPKGDMAILDFDQTGNYIAVRPSGTEPKVKIYLFAYDAPTVGMDVDAVRAAQAARMKAIGEDFRKFAGA